MRVECVWCRAVGASVQCRIVCVFVREGVSCFVRIVWSAVCCV